MFKKERISVLENKDRTIKLLDSRGVILGLLFVRGDKLIIRGDLDVEESTIEPPEIKNL